MNILFIDDYLVVCEKPVGVLSEYDDKRANMPTLLAAELNGAPVTVLNRLDREVGGVMVLGLHPLATAQINKQISERTFKKEYKCIKVLEYQNKYFIAKDYLKHNYKRYFIKKVKVFYQCEVQSISDIK